MSCTCPTHDLPPPPPGYRRNQKLMAAPMRWMGLSCRRHATLSALRLARPLTALETVQLHLHGWMCGMCRRVPDQFDRIARLFQAADEAGLLGEVAPPDPAVREAWRARLREIGG